jgi:hypothetical protein
VEDGVEEVMQAGKAIGMRVAAGIRKLGLFEPEMTPGIVVSPGSLRRA